MTTTSQGLLLVNGRIYTVDPSRPIAEAVAIEGNRILAVGKDGDLKNLAKDRGWEVVDLGGRAVLPGLIDSHIHFLGYATGLTEVSLEGVESLEQALEIIAAKVKDTEAGQWITGRGWDQNRWGGFPTKQHLDSVAALNPVALRRKDGHLLWVNSLALAAMGIDRNTPDPPGGEITRDEQGEPTGILKENATHLLEGTIPEDKPEIRERALRRATEIAQSRGLTGIQDMEGGEAFSDFQHLLQQGELGLRVYMCLPSRSLEDAVEVGVRTGFGNEYLRLGHLKIFADGTLGSQTADMLEPFAGQPNNRGIEVTSQPELERLVEKATQNGMACAIHAIGDRAVRRALDAIAKANAWQQGLRPRIEHVQLIHPQDIPRFAELGVIASMQPIHASSDMLIADKYWGSRAGWSYAWKTLLQAGVRLAFGSDSPVEDLNPLVGIHAAVTRQQADGTPSGGWYPEQQLSVEQAVYGYTMGAAYASGEENIKGSLTPGKLADLVVLSQDIFQIPPADILNTRVTMTIFDGRVVYTAAGGE